VAPQCSLLPKTSISSFCVKRSELKTGRCVAMQICKQDFLLTAGAEAAGGIKTKA